MFTLSITQFFYMSRSLFFLAIAIISSICAAQNVNIPDANFKACLVSNSAINTNGDGEIQISEAANFSATINCQFMDITDITGIEAFTNLSNGLILTSNPVVTVNLTNSPSLQFFTCDGCPIENFDVSGLSNLSNIFVQFANITSFDATGLIALDYLNLNYAPLTSITFSGNNNLTKLHLDATEFTNIDLSQLPLLEDFRMQGVDIDQIDFSNNTNLVNIGLSNSGLQSLDLSSNVALTNLAFTQLQELTALDLSQNAQLEELNVSNSFALSTLTLASGNNIAITNLNTNGCSALFCIEVDATIDIVNPPTGWVLGSGTSLSYDCTLVSPPITITDANFKSCLLSDPTINTNGDNEIQLSEANSFSGQINCSSQGISDLTGIEEFINAENMFFNNNLLTEFTGPINTNLEVLAIAQNNLTQLDVSENTGLEVLELSANNFSAIDVSQLINLLNLRVNNNDLTSIDITNNPDLIILSATNNAITQIDLSQNPVLFRLRLGENPLTSIDLSNSLMLEKLVINECELETLDVSNNLLLDDIFINENNISELDVSMLPLLISLYCAGNDLDILNIANGFNEDLLFLDATANPNLDCIQVDTDIDINNPPVDWLKDVTSSYSYDCMFLVVETADVSEIALYPNPTSDIITITSEMPIHQVSVFNVQGSLLFQKKENSFSLKTLPSGIYFLSISTTQGQVITRKISKR